MCQGECKKDCDNCQNSEAGAAIDIGLSIIEIVADVISDTGSGVAECAGDIICSIGDILS